MITRYLNVKNYGTIETVDSLSSDEFKGFREFKKELKRLVNEYRLAGVDVYISQRSAKDYQKD